MELPLEIPRIVGKVTYIPSNWLVATTPQEKLLGNAPSSSTSLDIVHFRSHQSYMHTCTSFPLLQGRNEGLYTFFPAQKFSPIIRCHQHHLRLILSLLLPLNHNDEH